MVLNFNVTDNSNKSRGDVRVKLDFGQKKWFREADPQQVFQRVSYSSQGTFEVKSWGVLWLWDQIPGSTTKHNTLIIWDAPTGEGDATHKSGRARIFDPKDKAFKDGTIGWNTSAPAAATTATAPDSGLTGRRGQVMSIVKEVTPCQFLDAKYKKNPYAPAAKGAGTTCGCLPAYVAFKLGNKFPPVTTGLPAQGKKRNNSWVMFDGKNRPKPGDLYALVTGAKQDINITHVGVIVDPSGPAMWVTADWGQFDGYGGKDRVERTFDPVNGTLTGEKHDGGAPRPIYGWIDIEKFCGDIK